MKRMKRWSSGPEGRIIAFGRSLLICEAPKECLSMILLFISGLSAVTASLLAFSSMKLWFMLLHTGVLTNIVTKVVVEWQRYVPVAPRGSCDNKRLNLSFF